MQSGIFQSEGNFLVDLQVHLTVLVGCKGSSKQLGDILKEERDLSSVLGRRFSVQGISWNKWGSLGCFFHEKLTAMACIFSLTEWQGENYFHLMLGHGRQTL